MRTEEKKIGGNNEKRYREEVRKKRKRAQKEKFLHQTPDNQDGCQCNSYSYHGLWVN